MANTSRQEEFLAVIRKSQEAVIAVITNLAETVRTANLPKPPSVSVPFADKQPRPEDAVARTYDFAEQLLASQRKFAEDLLKAKPEGDVAGTYDFAEQLLANQRKFAEDLLKAAAPPTHGHAESTPTTETYKPGQVVPATVPSNARGTTTSKTTSKPVPDSHRALITTSIVRAVPGNTSRSLHSLIDKMLSKRRRGAFRCERAGTMSACLCGGSRSRGRRRSRSWAYGPCGGCGLRRGSGRLRGRGG